MNSRNIGIAALAALLLLMVGLVFHPRTEHSTPGATQSNLLFPDLADKLNDVARIVVADSAQTSTLEKSEEGWVLREKSGFPADMKRVRQTLISLSELRKLDPKTSRPERYERLGVRDIDQAGSAAKRIELTDAQGNTMAGLLVGKRRSGAGDPAFYVRPVGQAQAWLVAGDLRLQSDPKSWLDRNVLAIKADRMRAVEIRHPDGKELRVAKVDKTAKRFDVQDLPAGRELRYATIGDGVGRALERLTFDDVFPASETEIPQNVISATFHTFDGEIIHAKLWQSGEQKLAHFEASFDEEAIEPEEPEESQEAAGDSTASVEEQAGADLGLLSPDAVRAEVDALNSKLGSWVYQLPSYSYDRMTKQMKDMLKEPEAAKKS